MTMSLERRAKLIRSRAIVRSFEYRQRDLAHGVWFKLRRLLASARDAYAIDDGDARRLGEEGIALEPIGSALEPPKSIRFVSEARLASLVSRRSLALRLDGDLLSAKNIALVRF